MSVSPVSNSSADPTQGGGDIASVQDQLTSLKKQLDKIQSCSETAKAEQTRVKLLEAQIAQKKQQIQKLQTVKTGSQSDPSKAQTGSQSSSASGWSQKFSTQSFEAYA